MKIDDTIFQIEQRLWKKYGTIKAEGIMEPLKYYIYTGRAPAAFEKLLNATTSRQKTTIANRLAKHYLGDYNAAINSVCEYLGFRRE